MILRCELAGLVPHLTSPSVLIAQEEANKNKHDTIPQAVQRMWTSPLRLRKKELCSILNFAVRCDAKEIVNPLTMLVSPSKSFVAFQCQRGLVILKFIW